MKTAIFIVMSILISATSFGQTKQPRTFLFVPGAWDGGWDYKKVDSILTSQGDIVYRPTLTGLGERVHLANADINLTTYVTDIVNVIKFEDLHNIILVGHSYGGMVIENLFKSGDIKYLICTSHYWKVLICQPKIFLSVSQQEEEINL